jgi:hypothetical protein
MIILIIYVYKRNRYSTHSSCDKLRDLSFIFVFQQNSLLKQDKVLTESVTWNVCEFYGGNLIYFYHINFSYLKRDFILQNNI